MSDSTRHYERPLGPWAQRIAGVILAIAIVGVAWALGPSVIVAWRQGISTGEALAALIGIAVLLWFALLAIRLVRSKSTSGDVLPPAALIGFGIVIALAMCAEVAISFAWHVAVANRWEILEGFGLAAAAIAIGVQRRRRHSDAARVHRRSQ